MRINIPFVGTVEIRRRGQQEGDTELINDLKDMVGVAKEALKTRHKLWRKYDEYYNGIHLINKGIPVVEIGDMPRKHRDKLPINFCRSTVEQMIPVLIDAAPAWYAVYEGSDTVGPELAGGTTDFMQGFWYYVNMDDTLKEMLRDFVVYGTGVLRSHWDRYVHPILEMLPEGEVPEEAIVRPIEEEEDTTESEGGIEYKGDVNVEWCDPFCVFPDPAARKLHDCRFVALMIEMTEDDFKRQFPDVDHDDVTRVTQGRLEEIGRRDTEQGKVIRKVRMVEVWEVYHEFGERQTLYTGNQILWDGENPTPDYKFPLVLFANGKRGNEIWGRSEIQDLVAPQDFMNLTNYRIARHQRLTANPQKVTNDATLKTVTNEAGAIVYVKPNVPGNREGYCNWAEPPAISPQLFVWMSFLERSFDTLSGIQDVTQGIKPKGVTSGIALGILNEAGQARLRLMIGVVAVGLEKLGQLVLELMQENYTEERQIAFMGADAPQTATLGVGALKHPFLSGEGRMPFRIIVQSRGDLPTNPAAQLDIAIQMYTAGAIDRQELLTVAHWPRRDKIVERMEAKEQMQMQGQMAAMGAQGGMPQGAPQGAPQGTPEEAPGETDTGSIEHLFAVFTPEERVVVEEILQYVANGMPPPAEYEDFMRSLDTERFQVIQTMVMIITGGGQQVEGVGGVAI